MDTNNLNFIKRSVINFAVLWDILLFASILFLFLVVFLYLAPHLALALIPYLLLILLVLRLFQFISHSGDTYKNITQSKHCIRIFLFIALLTYQSSIHSKLVSYQHQDQTGFPFDLHKLALHQSEKNYILIRYVFSFVAYFVIHHFGTKQSYDGRNLHIMQAIMEIIDCITLFWEDNIISIESSFPHILLQDMPIEINLMKILATILMYYDLCIIFIAVVRYVLRQLFSSRCSYQATYIKVIHLLIANKSFGFFTFLLVYKVFSDCLISFFSYKFTLAKSYDKLKELEDSYYKILLTFFILWIIKDFMLLAYESRTIYDRLRSRILRVSKKLYFLGILDGRDQNIFDVQPKDQTKDDGTNAEERSLTGRLQQLMIQIIDVLVDFVHTSSLISLCGANELRNIKRNKIKDDLLWLEPCDPTLYEIQKMTQYIVGAESYMSSDYKSHLLTPEDPTDKKRNVRKTLEQLIIWQKEYEQDGIYFVQELLKINDVETDMVDESSQFFTTKNKITTTEKNRVSKKKEISFEEFEKWVDRAHDHVISLANILTATKETAKDLNKLVSAFLIGAIFVAWLKVFKYAESLKDFALIASPFLAATIFTKDPLKDLFQGFCFLYFIHPFEIGDKVRIGGKKMKVTAIGLWITTFSMMAKDGKRKIKEETIYPNSMLAKKEINKVPRHSSSKSKRAMKKKR